MPELQSASVKLARVENGGLLFTDNPAGVSGVDAGYSLPIGAQTLWFFGDVFLTDIHSVQRRYTGGVSNCALVVPTGRGTEPLKKYRFLTNPATGQARVVIPYVGAEGNETRVWPYGGWYSQEDRAAYLYYGRFRTTGTGALDFRNVGYGLARASTEPIDSLTFHRLPDADGSENWWAEAPEHPVFGLAVVGGMGGDQIGIIGELKRDGRHVGKLARVNRKEIANSAAYRYFSGTPAEPAWSADPLKAADIEGLNDFPGELSVRYNAWLGGFLAIHSVNIDERLRLSVAPHPWGPYRPIGEVGAPHQLFAKAMCYAGKEHPELQGEDGRILYITYVDNQRYWLQLLKVTLERG